MKLEQCQFINVLGDNNTVCWLVTQILGEETTKKGYGNSNNYDWGPEASEKMCSEVRDFPISGNTEESKQLTMGDLIDWTPKELISKVMLEEKIFETWYDGHVTLLGDEAAK
ncbi:hypothetical protein BGX33_008285 [Mortierella sp. NVP41]|nr:hypothetical protein BGX33_008285 [Mortierella sp. NVP41]